MENKEIFELIDYFEKSGLSELEIEDEGRKFRMKKGGNNNPCQINVSVPSVLPAGSDIAAAGRAASAGTGSAPVSSAPAAQSGSAANSAGKNEDGVEYVRSPIVGVYYKAASPEEPDFAAVGDRVVKGQTLCIIEAMKVMNELKSPCDGVIKAAYGINGELAEYDEILFEVKKC